jgi:hypothetical protein
MWTLLKAGAILFLCSAQASPTLRRETTQRDTAGSKRNWPRSALGQGKAKERTSRFFNEATAREYSAFEE